MGRLTNATMLEGQDIAPGTIYQGRASEGVLFRKRADGTFDRFEGNRHERRQTMKHWLRDGGVMAGPSK